MSQILNALVVDDEPQISGLVARVLKGDGWKVTVADSAEDAVSLLQKSEWSLVFCDVVLGGPDGFSVLRQFTDAQPTARFVLMTGHGSGAGALEATSTGAYDYLLKPFQLEEIRRISSATKEQLETRKRNAATVAPLEEPNGLGPDLPLIGTASKFVQCLKLVGRVSRTNLPVLISGESGTGKELIARAIHHRSKRASHRFVTVNCGAIPTELIESELFGHSKGSFTGADRERMGLWEEATGGTLFLDEITETNPLFQVKLLRALQEGEIRRVGSNRTVKVDVRVVAASNRDIEKEVENGTFRQDLMYRLNAVTIHLPPLRERKEDIPLLAKHFVSKVLVSDGVLPTISSLALEVLQAYAWPGNIRELENAVLHAVSLCDDVIYPEHLPSRVCGVVDDDSENVTSPAEFRNAPNEWMPLSDMVAAYVSKVLAECNGNKQSASRILNIDRKTLSRIVHKRDPTP